jgi:hypothetical protein
MFIGIVIFVKHLNEKVIEHIDVNLAASLQSSAKANTLSFQIANLLFKGKSIKKKLEKHNNPDDGTVHRGPISSQPELVQNQRNFRGSVSFRSFFGKESFKISLSIHRF